MNTDAEKLIRRYRAIAYGYGFRSEAADIAQEAFLGSLERPQWKQTAHQRVVDAIRKLYGRDVGRGITDPLLNRLGGEDEERLLVSAEEHSQTYGINGGDIRKVVSLFEGTERAIFILRCVWGLDQKEIGYCFGISESRISQRLKRMEKEALRNMAQKEQVALQALCENAEIKTGSKGESESLCTFLQGKEGPRMECDKNSSVAKEESREMESDYGQGFPEWFA